jgi:hypothetical protein
MAIKESLTDLACKNASAEGSKIRKLHDAKGCIFGFMRMAVNIGGCAIRFMTRKNPYLLAFILLWG